MRAPAQFIFCAAALLILGAAPALRADKSPTVAQLISVADDAFEHGFFGDALPAYQDAYGRSGQAALLLKIGSCHERLSHWQEAAAAYRRYLASEPVLSPLQRQSLLGKVEALEARAHPELTTPSPAPLVLVAPPPVPARVDGSVGLRRALTASAIATAVVAVAAGGVTIGAANRFSQLGSDCQVDASGCSSSARARILALDHAADSLWALAAAGAVATLTIDLVLRHRRR